MIRATAVVGASVRLTGSVLNALFKLKGEMSDQKALTATMNAPVQLQAGAVIKGPADVR